LVGGFRCFPDFGNNSYQSRRQQRMPPVLNPGSLTKPDYIK
jgi:hypothetical protein